MTTTVTLFTDRKEFAPAWRPALERNGFTVRVCTPEELGVSVDKNAACVIDASSTSYDEDELLTAVGFLRALGAMPYVHIERDHVEDVVEEICDGRITRTPDDIDRAAATLGRRLDRDRCRRFEFVTVSPRNDEVLAILGDGHSVLLRRPVHKVDDGSEVVAIALEDDAALAVLELESGTTLSLQASSLAPQETPAPAAASPSTAYASAPAYGNSASKQA